MMSLPSTRSRAAAIAVAYVLAAALVPQAAINARAETFAELQERVTKEGVDRVADEMLRTKQEGVSLLIGKSLDQSRRELRTAPEQLWFQLTARNVGAANDELARFLGKPPAGPMLVPKSASLRQTSPAVLRTAFDGDVGATYLRLSNDGAKLFCSANDLSLRVLDADSLKEIARFEWPAGSHGKTAKRVPDPFVGIDDEGNIRFAEKSQELSPPIKSGWERAFAGVHDEFRGFTSSGIITPDGTHLINYISGSRRIMAMKLSDPAQRIEFGHDQPGYMPHAIFMRVLPDGERLVVGDQDGFVCLYQWRTGRQLQPARQLVRIAAGCAISADSKRLAVAASNPVSSGSTLIAKVWDIEKWKEVAAFKEPEFTSTWSIDFLGDSDTIVTLGSDRSGLKVWRVGSDRPVRALATPGPIMRCVASRSGKQLYAIAENRALWMLDMEQLPDVQSPPEHTHPVVAVALTRNGRLAASLDSVFRLVLWDAQSGKPLDHLEIKPPPHVTFTSGEYVQLTFAADNESVLVSRNIDAIPTIIHWSGNPRKRRDVAVQDKRFIPRNPDRPSFNLPYLPGDGAQAVCFHGQDANRMTLVLIDSATGKTLRDVSNKPELGIQLVALTRRLQAFWGRDESGAFVTVADMNSDKTWRVASLADQLEKAVFSSKSDALVAYGSNSRDDRRKGHVLAFARIKTGKVDFVDVGGFVTALAVSPNGQFAVTSDNHGNLNIWDVDGAKRLATFTLDRNIKAIQCDGQTVVVGDEGGGVHLLAWHN